MRRILLQLWMLGAAWPIIAAVPDGTTTTNKPRILTARTLDSYPDLVAELDTTLKQLGTALEKNDAKAIYGMVDGAPLWDSIKNDIVLPNPASSEKMPEFLKRGLTRGILEQSELLAFSRHKLRRVELAKNDEAAIHLLTWNHIVGATTLELWLRKHNGKWRIFDLADTATGLRISTLMKMGFMGQMTDSEARRQALRTLQLAIAQVMEENIYGAIRRLKTLNEDEDLPSFAQSIRDLLLAALLSEDEPEEAANYLARLRKNAPGKPIYDFLDAQISLSLEKYDECLTHLNKFTEALGEDSTTTWLAGSAHLGLKDSERAREAFIRGLTEAPESVENLVGLAKTLPENDRRDILKYYRKAARPDLNFEELIVTIDDEFSNPQLTLKLIAIYEERFPKDPNIGYYRATTYLKEVEDAQKAIAAMEPFMKNIEETEDSDAYIDLFADAISATTNVIQNFQIIAHHPYAFEATLEHLYWLDKSTDMKTLIGHYLKDKPENHISAGYLASAEFIDKRYPQTLAAIDKFLTFNEAERANTSDIRIRSLLALKRYDQALKEAQWVDQDDLPFYTGLVHITRGDIEKAERAIKTCLEDYYDIWDFLEDEDYARALKHPTLKKLRETYFREAFDEEEINGTTQPSPDAK